MMDLIDRSELEPDTEWSEYYDGFTSYSQSQINGAVEVQAIPIPEGATNGDMIKALFPSDANELDMSKLHLMYDGLDYIKEFRKDWWNAPYKKEVKK